MGTKTETSRIGPPRIIVEIIAILIPREYRTALTIQLLANYTNFWNYLVRAGRGIRVTTIVQIEKSFNRWRFIGDLACLLVAFGTEPFPMLPIILTSAILALVLRDANSHPAEASGVEGAYDVAVMAGAVALAVSLFLSSERSWGIDGLPLALQLVVAMALVSTWRFGFRMKEPPRSALLDAYKGARVPTILFVLGVLALGVANTRIYVVDGLINHAIIFIPTFLIVTDIRQRIENLGRVRGPAVETLSDPQAGLKAKRNRLMRALDPMFWWSRLVGPLGFVALPFPIIYIVASVASGKLPSADVHWLILAGNSAACVALTASRLELGKVHAKVAAAIDQAIKEGRDK